MKMKKTLLISLAAMTIAGSAYAMRPGGPYGGPPPGPPPVAYLQEILDLSDEQAESLKALFNEQRAQRQEHFKVRREMREQMQDKISSILTKEQMQEFKMLKSRGRGRGKGCKYR